MTSTPAECLRDLSVIQKTFGGDPTMYKKVLEAHPDAILSLARTAGVDINAALLELLIPRIDSMLIEAKEATSYAGLAATPKSPAATPKSPAATPKSPAATPKALHTPWIPAKAKAQPNTTSLPLITGLNTYFPEDRDIFLHVIEYRGKRVRVSEDQTMPDGVPINWVSHGDGWFGPFKLSMTIHKYNSATKKFSLHREWNEASQSYEDMTHDDFVKKYGVRNARF
jgi:ribosomal protein L12E/L44/L45/RPP1/RPP2